MARRRAQGPEAIDTQIRPIDAAASRPVRGEVLRPGRPLEELVFAEDDAPDTLHVGAFVEGKLVGVGRVSREPRPGGPSSGDVWRIRGMATLPDHRGRGVGGAVLRRLLEHAEARGGTEVWCNARLRAASFYERAGFAAEGEPFELEGIGPHRFMAMRLGLG